MMTETKPALRTSVVSYTTSEIRRSAVQDDVKPFHAHYYNLNTMDGKPVAGLLVLLDRRRQPVRAELHLHTNTAGYNREMAQRQARALLQNRYTGTGAIPLSLVRDHLEQEQLMVPLTGSATATVLPRSWLWMGLAGAGLLVMLLFLGQMLYGRLFSGPADKPSPAAVTPASVSDGVTVRPPVAETADSPQESFAPQPTAIVESGELDRLPPSRNALPLQVGQQIRIRPGLSLTLRSEPGAAAGQSVGYLQNAATATILRGPVLMAGERDTIVWWFVRVDANGQEAWAAANTSEFTLLEPVAP